MKKSLYTLAPTAALLAAAALLTGCAQSGTDEQATAEANAMGDDLQDSVSDMGESMERSADDMGADMATTASDMEDAIENGADVTAEAVDGAAHEAGVQM